MRDHLYPSKPLIVESRNVVAGELRVVQVRKTKTLRYYIRDVHDVYSILMYRYTRNIGGVCRRWVKLKGPLIDHLIVLHYAYYYIKPTIWTWYYELNDNSYIGDYNILDYLLRINSLPKVIWSIILDYIWVHQSDKRINAF
jgi:hypothetical protein